MYGASCWCYIIKADGEFVDHPLLLIKLLFSRFSLSLIKLLITYKKKKIKKPAS
jgi:hypothetical protein